MNKWIVTAIVLVLLSLSFIFMLSIFSPEIYLYLERKEKNINEINVEYITPRAILYVDFHDHYGYGVGYSRLGNLSKYYWFGCYIYSCPEKFNRSKLEILSNYWVKGNASLGWDKSPFLILHPHIDERSLRFSGFHIIAGQLSICFRNTDPTERHFMTDYIYNFMKDFNATPQEICRSLSNGVLTRYTFFDHISNKTVTLLKLSRINYTVNNLEPKGYVGITGGGCKDGNVFIKLVAKRDISSLYLRCHMIYMAEHVEYAWSNFTLTNLSFGENVSYILVNDSCEMLGAFKCYDNFGNEYYRRFEAGPGGAPAFSF